MNISSSSPGAGLRLEPISSYFGRVHNGEDFVVEGFQKVKMNSKLVGPKKWLMLVEFVDDEEGFSVEKSG